MSWRTPQRASVFCRALSETHEVHVTDWDAEYHSLRDYASRRYIRNFSYRINRDGKITVHGIPRISPALFWPVLRRFNSAVFSFLTERMIKQFQIDVVVGTFVARPPRGPRLIFDVFDDNAAYWSKYGIHKEYAHEIEESESQYYQAADAVVVASSVLADRAGEKTSRPIYLIPNGVDTARFRHANGRGIRAQWDASGCIVGVLGNHNRPEELRVLLEVASILAEENYTFIVAGRGSAIPESMKRARKIGLTKIIFIGGVPLENAPDFVAAFDIGLCLYSRSRADDARSPMRLLMYTAAGLPTVCTNLEEVRRMQFPNVITVEDDPQSFVDGIRRAQQFPRAIPKQIEMYDLSKLTAQYEQVLKGNRRPKGKANL